MVLFVTVLIVWFCLLLYKIWFCLLLYIWSCVLLYNIWFCFYCIRYGFVCYCIDCMVLSVTEYMVLFFTVYDMVLFFYCIRYGFVCYCIYGFVCYCIYGFVCYCIYGFVCFLLDLLKYTVYVEHRYAIVYASFYHILRIKLGNKLQIKANTDVPLYIKRPRT